MLIHSIITKNFFLNKQSFRRLIRFTSSIVTMSKNEENKVKRVYFIENSPENVVWVKDLKIQDGQMLQASRWKRQ